MDVYLLLFFWGGRSRRNDFGQGKRDEEGGMRKMGFCSFILLSFILFPFYPFTLLPFLEFPSY